MFDSNNLGFIIIQLAQNVTSPTKDPGQTARCCKDGGRGSPEGLRRRAGHREGDSWAVGVICIPFKLTGVIFLCL